MTVDLEAVARAVDPNARRSGDQWVFRCPTHEDRRASASVGLRGDTLVVHCHAGCDNRTLFDAVRRLAADVLPSRPPPGRVNGHHGLENRPRTRQEPRSAAGSGEGAAGPPEGPPDAVSPPAMHPPAGCSLTSWWRYVGRGGGTAGFVLRWDGPGGKEIRPLKWDGHGFVPGAMARPRPMLNLPAVSAGAGPVLVVEGEKAADAVAAHWPRAVVTTWAGGASAWHMTDWSALRGRRVALWPDNDRPGFAAMASLGEHLRGLGCNVGFIVPPADLPSGFDAADMDAMRVMPREVMEWQTTVLPDRFGDSSAPAPAPREMSTSSDEADSSSPTSQAESVPESGDADESLPATVDEELLGRLHPAMGERHLSLVYAEAFRDTLRWSPGLGWMVYTDRCWERDQLNRRIWLAGRLATAASVLNARGDGETRRLTKWRTITAMAEFASADPRLTVPSTAWDSDPLALNTPSGMIDLRTGALRPRTSADLVTKCTGVSPDFDRPCPVFDKFMRDVFQEDEELIEFVQRMVGLFLTGDRRDQYFYFWLGSGGNGKSRLLDLLCMVSGGYAHKLPSAALMVQHSERHPADLAALQGVRMAWSSELEAGQMWNEQLIKELTGDDLFTARFMRQDPFSFRQTQKHVVMANNKPRIRTVDRAIERRMLLVPFDAEFTGPAVDKAMGAKLAAEAPQVLAWAIAGARKWYEDGLNPPRRVLLSSQQYLQEQDDVANWMAISCNTGRPEMRANAMSLYRSFCDYKSAMGEKVQSAKSWFQQLQSRGFVKEKDQRGLICYQGIELRQEELMRLDRGSRASARFDDPHADWGGAQ